QLNVELGAEIAVRLPQLGNGLGQLDLDVHPPVLPGVVLQAENSDGADKMRVACGSLGVQVLAVQEHVDGRSFAPARTHAVQDRKDPAAAVHNRAWAGGRRGRGPGRGLRARRLRQGGFSPQDGVEIDAGRAPRVAWSLAAWSSAAW